MAMTPGSATLAENIIETSQYSKTYHIDTVNKRICDHLDGIAALKQAVTKLLNTERQSCLIYGADYGVELERFIGKEKEFVIADIERTIKDALLCDDRILEISDFDITSTRDSLHVSFSLLSIYGPIQTFKEVSL